MGRMWEVAWTEDDSAIVEVGKKMMNSKGFREFLLSWIFGRSKEVKGRWCRLLYWGLRREKYLPKSSIEIRKVFPEFDWCVTVKVSDDHAWERVSDSLEHASYQAPFVLNRFKFTRACLCQRGTVSNSHTRLRRQLEIGRFKFACVPFLPPFEIKSIRLPPESATLHLIPVTASFE